MAEIILDLGSGNTCRNDKKTVETMIRQIAEVDTGRHEIVLKWQLFEKAEPNVPLDKQIFEYAYTLAQHLGYKTTASVFDYKSMHHLMKYDVPFVKIANNPQYYHLIDKIAQMQLDIPVYVSIPTNDVSFFYLNITYLACISKYPATIQDYAEKFPQLALRHVSDHTVGWDLYNTHKPKIIEKHFVHKRLEGNPDAGMFAVTQKELAEIL